jgi:hypothetical protein
MANKVTALLWADDDSLGSLDPLGRRLRRSHFDMERAVDYSGAMELLKYGHFDSLLLDVILPFAQGAGALEFDLGMRLADEAPAICGSVRNIAFLTVVQPQEVDEKYKAIAARHADRVAFDYFDKTKLLEPAALERIMQFLRR